MVEGEVTRKRMGRPPKAPEKGKRQNYTFRMSDADRDKIILAAESSGRSMSEEIERRVEQSFELDELLKAAKDAGRNEGISASINFFHAVCGGTECFKFGRSIANALHYAMQAEGITNIKYKDIKNKSDSFIFVDDFVRKCVTNELTSNDTLDYSDLDAISIKSTLDADGSPENEPTGSV